MRHPSPTERGSRRGPSISPRLTAALAVALIAAVVIFLVTRGGNGSSSSTSSVTPAPAPAASRGPASAANQASLLGLQSQLGHPVYWAGAIPARVLAAQKDSQGTVYLRYLTPGTDLNTKAESWLSVVTYPESNPYALAQQGAKRPGAKSHHLAGGLLAVSPPNLPTNVFLARPGSTVLVEVFDPAPGAALRDVLSGRIRPVG